MVVFSNTFLPTGAPLNGLHLPNTAYLVVGDVHGQRDGLHAVLQTLGQLKTPGLNRTLVFLGDLIDRGPDSLGALTLSLTQGQDMAKADNVVFLPGNHELMLADALLDLAAVENGAMTLENATGRRSPFASWIANGGMKFLIDTVEPGDDTLDTMRRFNAALPGENGFAALVRSWPAGVLDAGLCLVHAGIHPKRPAEATLATKQEDHFPRGWNTQEHDLHWAWIREPFLNWQGGFKNADGNPLLVLHGHSIPSKATHDRLFDQERLQEVLDRSGTNGRICLDAGAARGVGVAAAVVTPDGVQLLAAPC